ncbi:Uncharacterised protein [Enterobacter roggenkampii]|nr:Uncharacterised protein [Enterobacter roggenkampii]
MLPDNLNKLAMRLILFKDNQPLTSLQHGFSTLSHVEACLVNDAVTFIWQAITKLLHDFKAMFGHGIKIDAETIGQRYIFH